VHSPSLKLCAWRVSVSGHGISIDVEKPLYAALISGYTTISGGSLHHTAT
jgi:hypothetical protein